MQVTLSTRDVHGLTKAERADIKYYSRFIKCEFADLLKMLVKDYMFNPFNYIGYTQSTNNICSDANFVVIDVDSTSLSITDRLDQLIAEDLQCIIATTSDSANLYKYRILMPIDRSVDLREYRGLVTGIAVNGLVPELDPVSSRPAQKFYAYANSTVLHSFTGKPLVVDDYIVDLSTPEYASIGPPADITEVLHEFQSYQFASKGKRTRSLISAGYKCLEYGLTNNQLEQVIYHVNSLFLVPKDKASIQRRVLNFIKSQRRS
jgi:hypothetical protein